MKFKTLLLFSTLLLSFSVLAGDWSDYKKFSGSYIIYGGELGDISPPKSGDKKIAIQLDKKISKEIFDSIGPDLTGSEVCVANPKDRYRKKGNVECIRSHDGGYSCTFGFDLTTGKSIIGSIC